MTTACACPSCTAPRPRNAYHAAQLFARRLNELRPGIGARAYSARAFAERLGSRTESPGVIVDPAGLDAFAPRCCGDLHALTHGCAGKPAPLEGFAGAAPGYWTEAYSYASFLVHEGR